MMQTSRISDALRGVLLNAPRGPNLACPRVSVSSMRPLRNATLWKEVLAQRRDRVTVAWWDGLHLRGLASAHIRTGYRAWEIDRLYLLDGCVRTRANGYRGNDSSYTAAPELLERMVQMAGERRAERVFLRVPSKSPLLSLARRSGFFPYFEETLLEGRGGQSQRDGASAAELQERLPEYDHALFQLFCAATPQQVRVGLGLTFDQWLHAQEPRPQGRREWVTKNGGRITGWLGLGSRGRVEEGDLLAHPDFPELLPGLLEAALGPPGLQRWLVPNYQEVTTSLLLRHGFREVACYTMLIKTLAIPVMCRGLAPVEA